MIVVIVGVGSIGLKHLNALLKVTPAPKIFGLRSDTNAPLIDGLTNILRIEDIGQKPDLILIANPTIKHVGTITDMIKYGAFLMIEKPVLHDLEQAEAIGNLIEQQAIGTYVACNLRFHPGLLFVKKYIAGLTHTIQEVNMYCGSYLPDWRPGRDFKTLYSAKKELGGGVHLDLIHEIDYCYWLFGKPKAQRRFLSSKSALGIDVPDYANYLLEYETFNSSIVLNYYRRDAKRSLEIILEDETLTLDLLSSTVTGRNGAVLFSANYSMLDTYSEQISHVMKCMEGTEQSMNTFRESIEVLTICLTDE